MKEFPVLFWSWDCLALVSQRALLAHSPLLSEEHSSAPLSRAHLLCFVCWVSTFFFLGVHHLATVWDLVRGRGHLPLMKPERPYTLSCSSITTQPPCSWGESMWPRLGQSNIPSLDLELGLGHTRELRWGGLFLAVIETMSSFQGQQGQGDKQWDLVSSA